MVKFIRRQVYPETQEHLLYSGKPGALVNNKLQRCIWKI